MLCQFDNFDIATERRELKGPEQPHQFGSATLASGRGSFAPSSGEVSCSLPKSQYDHACIRRQLIPTYLRRRNFRHPIDFRLLCCHSKTLARTATGIFRRWRGRGHHHSSASLLLLAELSKQANIPSIAAAAPAWRWRLGDFEGRP